MNIVEIDPLLMDVTAENNGTFTSFELLAKSCIIKVDEIFDVACRSPQSFCTDPLPLMHHHSWAVSHTFSDGGWVFISLNIAGRLQGHIKADIGYMRTKAFHCKTSKIYTRSSVGLIAFTDRVY